MHVVHIPRQTMIDIAQRSKEKGLLNRYKRLIWSTLIQVLTTCHLVCGGFFDGVRSIPIYILKLLNDPFVLWRRHLYGSRQSSTLHDHLSDIIRIGFAFGGIGPPQSLDKLGRKKVLTLLKEPFIFVDNARILLNLTT